MHNCHDSVQIQCYPWNFIIAATTFFQCYWISTVIKSGTVLFLTVRKQGLSKVRNKMFYVKFLSKLLPFQIIIGTSLQHGCVPIWMANEVNLLQLAHCEGATSIRGRFVKNQNLMFDLSHNRPTEGKLNTECNSIWSRALIKCSISHSHLLRLGGTRLMVKCVMHGGL